MKDLNFTLDIENIKKAVIIPGIIALVIAFTYLIDLDLGVFFSLIFSLLTAFAGINYLITLMASGKSYLLINAGLNGGLVAGLVVIIFRFLNWFFLGIGHGMWSTGLGWTFMYVIEAILIGFMGVLAWHAYQNDKHMDFAEPAE